MTVIPDLPPPPEPLPPQADGSPQARTSRGARAGRGLRRTAPFAVGAGAMLLAVLVLGAVQPAPMPLTRSDVDEAVASALASQEPKPALSELVYQSVAASIVLIETTGTDADDEPERGQGTGVVINDSADVLTALHVVADATSIQLTFADGSRRKATVTSADPATDIAVIAPETPPETVTAATLGNPGSLRVGSEAYIVGNPFGLYGSLSVGVVSGLDRTFRDPDTGTEHEGLIQVDAAVNPGNSGGPLLDRSGRVLGIVTALINPTDQRVFIGLGLAVPIDVAGGGAGLPQY